MKFDTPADDQPDRPAQGRRQASSTASTARSRPPAPRPMPMSGTTSSPNQAYGYVLGAGIAKGRITAIDTRAAKAAPGVLADRDHARHAASSDKGKLQHRLPVRRPRDRALPPGDRRRRGRDLRAGARRRVRWSRVDYARAARPLRPGRRGAERQADRRRQRRRQRRPGGGPRRRLRGRLRRARRSSSTRPTPRPTRATR